MATVVCLLWARSWVPDSALAQSKGHGVRWKALPALLVNIGNEKRKPLVKGWVVPVPKCMLGKKS